MKPDSGQKLRETAARLRLEQDDSETSPATQTDPMIGTVLSGHLEIMNWLGRGGMSVVYKAKDLLLNRIVAVKLLLAHNALDPKNVARFRQEAMAASKLDHPNIIRIYEFNVPEEGPPYLVMDYIEGQSLADLISTSGAIELRRAISIIKTVCDGLEHAHSAGVVHRDLKPGNIMLLKDASGKQTVKIVDFGIAKLLENDQSHGLTQTGELFGSPLYMSPEQCLGKKLDNRTDIYALGCVLYEMVTGKPPLKGATVLETIQMQTTEMPKSVLQVHPGIKNADKLDAVLLKAMVKDAQQRYQSASEFRSALQELGAESDQSVIGKAKLKWQVNQLKGTSHKLPTLTIVMTVVIMALIGVAVTLCQNYLQVKNQLNSTQQAQSLKVADDKLKSELEAQWTYHNSRGLACLAQNNFTTAEQEFLRAREISLKLGAAAGVATSLHLVDTYARQQKVLQSRAILEEVIRDNAGNHTHSVESPVTWTYERLVSSYLYQLPHKPGDLNRAHILSIELCNRVKKYGTDDPRVALSNFLLGTTYARKHDSEKAKPLLEAAILYFDRVKSAKNDIWKKQAVKELEMSKAEDANRH